MIEIRRILCPTDFSEFSRRALEHATALARWYEAGITALHVVPLAPTVAAFPPNVNPVTLEPVQREVLLRELEQFVQPARAAGVPVDLETFEGNAAIEIVRRAREMPADLVVMGTHGRGGFERWVLGSVAEKVLRKAPSPVLTVTRPAEEPPPGRTPFKRILCPVDFSAASMKALEYALSLAEEADACFMVLHVLETLPGEELRAYRHFNVEEYRRFVEEDVRERLHRAVPEGARNWCEPRELLATGKAYREILRVAQEQKAELIVMGVHGRSPIDLMLFGSTANHVVRGATCPVLTIRTG